MEKVREKAFKLRLRGYSYNEIRNKLGVPKSTQSGWFKDMVLSERACKRLEARKGIGTEVLIKRNKEQTVKAWKRAKNIQHATARKVKKLNQYELALVGAALYWGEGYKRLKVKNGIKITNHIISFANSDAEMIKLFITFLLDILGVQIDDIKLDVRVFPHLSDKECLTYWKSVTGLPIKNFNKPSRVISISSKRKRPFNRLPYGTVQVRVNSTEKFHTIMGWIKGLKIQSNMPR